MTLTYFNDINVYFHMRNHYKMLKNVKSVVDTSIPQSLLKSPMAVNNWDKHAKGAANEHLRKIYNTPNQGLAPKRRGLVKKHSCLNSAAKSEVSLRTASHHSRPSTRRNLNALPKDIVPARPFSVGPTSKSEKMLKFRQKKMPSVTSLRSNNSEAQNSSLQLDLPQDSVDRSENVTPPNSKRSHLSSENKDVHSSHVSAEGQNRPKFVESAEDHEYLLFLLRITEDIISNDFYSNNDIKKIFQLHIELNKDRLNMRKMHLHIANLCRELSIDCKEYQITEDTFDQSDSPRKFQNSPNGHHYVLNSEAFKNCQDCSVIRTSSLYKMHSAIDEYCTLGGSLSASYTDGIGDGCSVSPSLLKLLDKLSLGRVTECTEPVPSTSTMNSPLLTVPNNIETSRTNNVEDTAKDPVDFDTFIKELNSEEAIYSISDGPIQNDIGLIAVESPPLEIKENISDCIETHQKNTNNLKSSTEGSKSYIELSEKELNSYSASEKYESEFEKCSSSNSVLTSGHKSAKNDEEEALEPNISHNKLETSSGEDRLSKSSKIPILIKESKAPEICLDNAETNMNRVSADRKLSPTQSSKPSKTQLKDVIEQDPGETSDRYNSDNQKNVLKIILQGSVKDDDYVMIKGPVFVYKPLLESQPKLIVFSDNNEDQKSSRRNSLDSQHSHRTFTVDHSHVLDQLNVDQGIQYDTSLHTLELDKSMENILELTKAAYSQFMDVKLLQSDYDLTPEKDGSDNKYHHLLVDATTSVSGMNITESLLLNDDYLVNASKEGSSVDMDRNLGGDIDSYMKFEPKMYENHYVIHRKLLSSVSMPKLRLNSGRVISDRNYTGRSEELRSHNVVKKCSSDLLSFDVPSQDSSLRSEGEAIQNYDCTKNGVPWNRYYN